MKPNEGLAGIAYRYSDGTYSLWGLWDINMDSADEEMIMQILSKYEDREFSVRGRPEDIELADVFGTSE